MAAPNLLFTPTIARPHAEAAFLEVMEFLRDDVGLIDFIPDSSNGGDFVHLPRHGKISSGFGRLDAIGASDITTAQTAKTLTFKDEIAVVRHRGLLFEYFSTTPERAGETIESFSEEVGRQIGIEAAKDLILNLYQAADAAADAVTTSHLHTVYVNDTDSSDQVDFTASVLNTGKGLLGDLQTQLDWGVMRGKVFTDLTASSISTDFNVPNIMGDVYREGQFKELLGTRWIVDDQLPTAAGPTTGSPLKFRSLLFRSRRNHPLNLAPLVVSFQRPLIIYEQHVLGAQSVKFQRQPELSYAIGVRGMQWKESAGSNPTDAAFTTAGNWDDAHSDHKEVGVVIVETNAS